MSRSVSDILNDPMKGKNRTQGVLCYLFRDTLIWRRITQVAWNRMARMYFDKPHNKDNQDKGNLNKSLTQDDFTWGTFKKAIDFLNPYSAVFIVELTWRSGRSSTYRIIIDPAENEEDPSINTFGDDGLSDVFADMKKPANTLARLFRRIVTDEGIVDRTRWNALFEEYVNNPLYGYGRNQRDLTTAINTLQRDVLSSRMSWNVFRKGITILNPIQEDYVLEVTWHKDPATPDRISTHRVTIRDPLSIKPRVS